MRLECKFRFWSFVYLLLLPLNGSHARGEKQGLLAWRQPGFFNDKYLVYSGYGYLRRSFFFAAPGVKYV